MGSCASAAGEKGERRSDIACQERRMSESSVLVLVLVLVERRDMVWFGGCGGGGKRMSVGRDRWCGWLDLAQEPRRPQGFCSWSRQQRFDMRSPVHGTDGPRLRR